MIFIAYFFALLLFLITNNSLAIIIGNFDVFSTFFYLYLRWHIIFLSTLLVLLLSELVFGELKLLLTNY
jgi:hypothetical protein